MNKSQVAVIAIAPVLASPASAEWFSSTDTDAMTDQREARAMVVSTTEVNYDNPLFAYACSVQNDGTVNEYISLVTNEIHDRDKNMQFMVRIDKNSPVDYGKKARVVGDYRNIPVLARGINEYSHTEQEFDGLVDSIKSAQSKIIIRTTEMTVEFPASGAKTQIEKARNHCYAGDN